MVDINSAMNKRPEKNETRKASSKSVGANRYLTDPGEGLKLLADLVSNKSKGNKTDKILDEIYKMITEEFFDLAQNDVSPRSAKAYKGLLDAYNDLVEICLFPAIENKHIVAVGGHFSAGKSKFLNSIIGDKKLLPIDQTPTTSIPTYILKGKEDTITALNYFENKIELDSDALKVIAHDFHRTYGLSFSHLLKLITVERKNFPYENIMFIDTPGYSKADTIKTRHSNTDENIAREHLRSAELLIWLIDIKNGTIPNEDIGFIKSLKMEEPILFVINKADLKIEKEIQKVVKSVRENVLKADLPLYDVIAYSSSEGKEYTKKGNVLKDFLKKINTVRPGTDIIEEFDDVFEEFLSYHQSQKELERSTRTILNESVFDPDMNPETQLALNSIAQRIKKEVDKLIQFEQVFEDFSKRLKEKVIEALQSQNIKITDGSEVKLNRSYRDKGKAKTYRFSASVDNKINERLNDIADINNIQGKIVKVSNALTKIKVLNNIDVIITDTEIKKETGKSGVDIFKEDQNVSVQYTGKNKAFVEVKLTI